MFDASAPVVNLKHSFLSTQVFFSPHQMVRVAWLFWFSKIIELMDTVSSLNFAVYNLVFNYGDENFLDFN